MNFRRWITALAVLTLFVGLASAQTGGNSALTCNTVAQVTPTIRAEGITELVGDVVITCTGGNYIAPGALIPQANIVVSLSAPVTSRLTTDTLLSEALLIVDEPNSGMAAPVALFGPEAPLNICTSPLAGCVAYARSTTAKDSSPIVVAGVVQDATSQPSGTIAPGANVFQGELSGSNQLTFHGVPILPPVTSGIQRVYRITNIRVNASGITSQINTGAIPINASISTNGASSLPLSNPSVTVAYVQQGLTPSVTDKPTAAMTQCALDMADLNSQRLNAGNVAILNFSENFPSAFKTRVHPYSTTAATSYLATFTGANLLRQNVPGQMNTSESGFVMTVNNSLVAGLANYGTRLKAVFNNLPAGATLYVSRYNVTSYLAQATAPAVVGGLLAVQPAYAALVSSETGAFAEPGGTGAKTAYSTTVTLPAPSVTPNVNAVPVTITSGSATAVWEVLNTNTSANEIFKFAVYLAYTPNTTAGTPTVTGTPSPTVTLSYAPTVSTTSIPRFIVGSASKAEPIINIVPCQTLLLFPYVTTLGGFDTGLAISNTSMDPVGTQTSGGLCKLYFYGSKGDGTAYTAPTTPLTLPSAAEGGIIAAGTPAWKKAVVSASTIVPDFQGYMFALCDFQYAHGFAFVSDIGARNLAMGYLALVVNNGNNTNTRGPLTPAGESLGN